MKAVQLFAILCCFSILTFAQTGGSLTGRVTQNGQPVAGATVGVTVPDHTGNKTINAITDSDGFYRFDDLKPGRHMIIAEGERGRGVDSGTVEIISQGSSSYDLNLTMKGYDAFSSQLRISESVTISADASQPLDEVSKSVSVISAQEMRDRADITLADSIRTVPGFRVQQLGGFGRTASIKSRGLRNQDTAILIDGVRFRDAASITGDATAFLSDLTLTSVSRVEVLRGPGSSLYGTNAIGGTVDFQTPRPQSGWHGQASGAAGGIGLRRFRGNISKGTDDGKFGFNAAVSRTVFTEGIDGNDDAANTNFQSRIEANPFERTHISARFFLSDAFVRLNSSPDTAGTPPASNFGIINAVEGVNFTPDLDDPDSDQRSRFFNGQFVLTQSVTDRFGFQAYYSGLSTRRRNDNGPMGVGFQSASTSAFEGAIHIANGHFDWSPNAANRLTVGYEFEHEDYLNEGSTPGGTANFFAEAAQSSNTLYLQHIVRLQDGRLQFAGGMRAQYFRLKSPGFSLQNAPYSGLSLDDPPAAYTFDGSASYFFSSTGTKIRVHAGNGYRVPSLYERFGTFFNTFPSNSFVALGDPYLGPERTAAFDAGVDQYFWRKRIRASATYFYSDLTDTIGYRSTAPGIGATVRPFGGYVNTEGGVARGLEVSGEFRPAKSTSVFASYTYTNSDQLEPQVPGSGVYRTLGIPVHQVTLTATQNFGRFWVNADLVAASSYIAPIFSNFNFNSYVYRFEGNRRLDATAGYTFTFEGGKYNLRLFATAENVFDDEYFENGFRTIGRTGRVGLSLSF